MSSWIRLAFLAVGAAVLLLIIAGTDVGELRTAVRAADRRLLGIAILLLLTNVGIKAVRWRFMAAQLSLPPLSLWQAGAAVLAGVAAGSLTPARGIELAKPLLLRRTRGVALSVSTATVIVERLLDGAGLIVLFGASLILLPAGRAAQFRPVVVAIGLLVVALGLLIGIPTRLSTPLMRIVSRLPLPDGIRRRAARLVEAFIEGLLIWRRREQLWLSVALSVAAAMVEALRVTVVFAAIGVPITVAQAMFAFSLANLIAVLAFIPGGVGVTELSMAGIVRFIAAGPGAAITAAVLVDRVLSYYLVVAVGSLILLSAGILRADATGGNR